MNRGELVRLTLRPEPDGRDHNGAPPDVRLRRLLKTTLRAFGWRCLKVETLHNAESRTIIVDHVSTKHHAGSETATAERLPAGQTVGRGDANGARLPGRRKRHERRTARQTGARAGTGIATGEAAAEG